MQRILIDAAHKEETRVALVKDNALQDIDRECLSVKQLKGNIYLGRITKVEASLQAAFVEYGGNRHGFLPFADIHPDYYNIQKADNTDIKKITHLSKITEKDDENNIGENTTHEDDKIEEDSNNSNKNDSSSDDSVESLGSYSIEDETEEAASNKHDSSVRIQDVMTEKQYILVQVLKEERGNKGVALTTYISIAGRYCVLMANNPGKGGVSKKVDNLRDRKTLRNILKSFNVPEDKSVIIRTAGVGKKPEEVTRDYIYLLRLWGSIKQATLESKAPCYIHAEYDVIKRCIRDSYNDDITEVIIEGSEAFKTFRSLANMISHQQKTNIKIYNEKTPIFHKFNIEQQIFDLYDHKVLLPSGSSIVIDQTEALVSIDVNSGKATTEKSVEETAVNTNIEAAKEIARQLRLRDLGGLIVIDFIDMYDNRNKRTVERTLRDALVIDKARIQVSKLSNFGLLEISRQRLGASFSERISEICQHCHGSGFVQSKEIVAISIFRNVRHAATDKHTGVIHVRTSQEVANYMLNYKRKEINELEENYDIRLFVQYDENISGNEFDIRKRKNLTEEEKNELETKEITGKVNEMFDDYAMHDDIKNSETHSYNLEPSQQEKDIFNKKRRQKFKGKKRNNTFFHKDKSQDFNQQNKGILSKLFKRKINK